MYSLEEKIRWFSIVSRLSVLLLQLILNLAIPDHNAGVFEKPMDENQEKNFIDSVIQLCFQGLSRWDAQYFLHIAHYGYTYENTLAFFPFFPFVIKQFAHVLFYVLNLIFYVSHYEGNVSFHSMLLLSASIINNIIFIKTTVVLFKLSLIILKNEKLAYVSSILFCINPASIFFSAAYSESLYCYLVFQGLLRIELNSIFSSSLLIGLSGLTRSNGIVNIGFICYCYLRAKINTKLSYLKEFMFLVSVIVSALPFAFYQLYCYLKYCYPSNVLLPQFILTYGVQNNFKLPGTVSEWCNHSIPFAYSYVQSHYWNVGFLQYYQIKQVPNFLLALPVFLIILRGSYFFFKLHKTKLYTLGLKNYEIRPFPVSVFVYVVHCLALTVFATFMIHIQVMTRLLFSSSPVPYWFSAWFVINEVKETTEGVVLKKITKKGKDGFMECRVNRNSIWKTFVFTASMKGTALWLKYYYLMYYFLGILMFSNYLPWT